jgi:hypothetical protein
MPDVQPSVSLAIILAIQVLALALVQGWISSSKEKRDAENRRKEKAEDYARQDVVAGRVAEAARQVAEVARVAKVSDERISAKLDEGLEQGKKIHILVNSDMTAARTSERDQAKVALIALKRVQSLSAKLGLPPDQGEQEAIEAAEGRITELNEILADRLAAQKRVDHA